MDSIRKGWREGTSCLFAEYSPLHHTPKTVRMTRTILDDFEAFAKASLKSQELFLDSVTREMIEAYQRIRLASGKSKSTVNVDVRHLRAFLRWCQGKGWLLEDPTKRVKLLRVVRREEESDLLVLTVEEVKTVYDELIRRGDLLVADLVKLIANQGFRINEALRLRARDVDLNTGFVYVRSWGNWTPKDKDSRKVNPEGDGSRRAEHVPAPEGRGLCGQRAEGQLEVPSPHLGDPQSRASPRACPDGRDGAQ